MSQHITVDGRLSPAQTLVGPNYSIGANLGKQVGTNLFHSFGQFNLATGENANFTPAGSTAPISNVIGRVTGGSASSINGTIRSTITGANLYLINPGGIVFGPNATVNVSGSFHASTADYLKMSNGAKFQATNPDGSTFSAAPPAAFGFLTASPAKIRVNGSTLGPVPGTLGLVGGPVSITGGTLSAPAGTIHVASVAGTGEVPVDPRNTAALTVTSFGPVGISGKSTFDVSNPSSVSSGGSVFIRSGKLTINASEINADNNGSGPGGQLVLQADGQITLSNGTGVHARALSQQEQGGSGGDVTVRANSLLLAGGSSIDASSRGSGPAGSVSVTTQNTTVAGGSQIKSESNFGGPGGSVTINATGSIMIDSTIGSSIIDVDSSGNAAAGAVTLAAQTLTLTGGSPGFGSRISANAGNKGNAGAVTVTLGQLLLLDDSSSIRTDGSGQGGPGNPGTIIVSAPSAVIRNGSSISSAVQGAGSGSGGSVTVNAGELILDGSQQAPGGFTGITTATLGDRAGANAGNVAVTATDLSIMNNGQIAGGTFGPGDGGKISVNVSNALTIDGSSSNQQLLTGIGAEADISATGAGGSIGVITGSLAIRGNGEIAGGSLLNGNGGQVSVSVAGLLSIDGSSGTHLTGIAAQGENGTGNAGTLRVSAGALSISNGGTISVNTTGFGIGGDALVMVGGTATLASGGSISSETTKSGNGGNVSVLVQGPLSLSGMGTGISASSTGSGNAGSVTVSAFRLRLSNGAAISTEAATSAASGGNITLSVGDLLYLVNNSQITTSVKGETGNGGNITIDPVSVVLDHSSIVARAIEGHGGNITITADEFIKSPDSTLSASSELGISGTVEIIGPRVDLNGALVVLSSELRSAAVVLRNSCAGGYGRPQSSLVKAGRGGQPLDPDATLPALYIAGRDTNPTSPTVVGPPQPIGAQQTTARLTMRCG